MKSKQLLKVQQSFEQQKRAHVLQQTVSAVHPNLPNSSAGPPSTPVTSRRSDTRHVNAYHPARPSIDQNLYEPKSPVHPSTSYRGGHQYPPKSASSHRNPAYTPLTATTTMNLFSHRVNVPQPNSGTSGGFKGSRFPFRPIVSNIIRSAGSGGVKSTFSGHSHHSGAL
jgi:hypothetical protein